ncbi:MAG: N-6 DNA methylase, partial [Bacteroidales bacterium]
MNREQAKKLIRETFESPFDKNNFIAFLKNLLKYFEEKTFVYQGNYIPDAFKQYISSLERIGQYTCDGKEIDLLVVQLKRETSLERARTAQRNFIAWYLKGSRGGKLKDASLVAFVSPDKKDWRFSLVEMDYRFEETPSGKNKVKEALTPARRWSFLVGKNEKSHTAQSRFVPILENDSQKPTLEDLEQAFNVEVVSKEFFQKYRDLFIRTKLELDKIVKNDAKVRQEFESKNINTVDFAKKLLGQITFLYFLQKKGWFGVARDNKWGSGPKHFLRELFEKKYENYKNFFNDILEPLFYEALRIDRRHDDDYYSRFGCKIPFLNGGLFDPINNYDWVHIDITLPNSLFSNSNKTKEGDTGDGILDVFDRYNFTVCEDEPLEKEVAIDPELLGKTYEQFNAIHSDNFDEFVKSIGTGEENKFNKSYGVYYTPREIVHYMCQQSLIEYLYTKFIEAHLDNEITKQDVEDLIELGELITEYEAEAHIKGQNIKNGNQKSSIYTSLLSECIRHYAKTIDSWLDSIAICDPAVGSGAFLVGMMTEIVRAKSILSVFLKKENNSSYEFKRHCIEYSLYGVDIDPGACEIAKLRLWLSLVVDEDDIRQIKPLPNLDYKIVCGDSLISVEKNLFNAELFNQLESLKPLLFNETNPTKKQEYKKQIDELIYQITNNHNKFDFKIYFSEVFHEKGGFDIVIANPPYIQLQKDHGKLANIYKNYGFETFDRRGDIYTLFYEKGLQILNNSGHLTFISSNKWMRAGYGEKLRSFFLKYNPKILIDLGPNVFESATVDTNMLIIQKAKNQNQLKAVTITENKKDNLDFFRILKDNGVVLSNLTKDAWFIGNNAEQQLKEKIEHIGKPLKDWDVKIYYGIKTGLNEAFIIDSTKRQEILSNCKDEDERRRTEAIIKPLLRGRDIKRYYYEWA